MSTGLQQEPKQIVDKISQFFEHNCYPDALDEDKQSTENLEKLLLLLEKCYYLAPAEEYKQDYEASLRWLSANGNEEDLELIQKVRLDSPYSSKEILRLFDIAERDIKKRLKKYFKLKGYSHPFDEYPAPIVPIGYYEHKLVAVYLDSSNSSDIFLDLDQDHQYIEFDDQFKRNLTDFNYLQDKLFAFSPDKIVSYPLAKEKEFYKDVLKDQNLSKKILF